jgi:MoaA/NifB/PqqE/SkfB family radical SAM enzyme
MPTELYRSILRQLTPYRETLEGVFMINYNEPTLDRRFVDQVGWIKEAGLPAATLTNGSGLTPQRVDALCALGGLRFLSINISTIDPEKYKKDRGVDQVAQIVRNLEYAGQHPVAEEMEMVVLGEGDAEHDRAFEEIRERFAGSRFEIHQRRLMNRAGYLQIGKNANLVGRRLGGCENIGSRPLQHLHITPHGQCVLCCEDYDEKYVVGDLREESLEAVLTGERFAQLRRWAYGVEDAPDDFICRHCIYALAR